jgi:hypothetical protein
MASAAPRKVSKSVSYVIGAPAPLYLVGQGKNLPYWLILCAILLFSANMARIFQQDENVCSGISFASINANSLNMSQANKPAQLKKIYGILKLKTDIILISDTRISNRCLVSSENDLVSIFRNNQYGLYTCYFNSTSNKRGVGILISNKISYSVSGRVADPNENYLLLKLSIQGKILTVGAVYGPNTTNQEFLICWNVI